MQKQWFLDGIRINVINVLSWNGNCTYSGNKMIELGWWTVSLGVLSGLELICCRLGSKRGRLIARYPSTFGPPGHGSWIVAAIQRRFLGVEMLRFDLLSLAPKNFIGLDVGVVGIASWCWLCNCWLIGDSFFLYINIFCLVAVASLVSFLTKSVWRMERHWPHFSLP